jgi:hypothetical protein
MNEMKKEKKSMTQLLQINELKTDQKDRTKTELDTHLRIEHIIIERIDGYSNKNYAVWASTYKKHRK